MKDNNEQSEIIRKYLLSLLDEPTAEEIGEKIVTDAEFFELVSQIEDELLGDFVAGRLNANEAARVELLYNSSVTDQQKLNFIRYVSELSKKNSPSGESASIIDLGEIDEPRDSSAEASVETKDSSPRQLVNGASSTTEDFGKSYFSNLSDRRSSLAYISLLGLIVAVGLAYFIWNKTTDSRASIETNLAKLNKDFSSGQINTPLLERKLEANPVRDISTSLPKVEILKNSNQVIYFQLELLINRGVKYQADFSDSQGKELFSISGLEPKTEGTQIFIPVFVRSEFFESGDYRIKLRGLTEDGSFIESGSFSFRLVKE